MRRPLNEKQSLSLPKQGLGTVFICSINLRTHPAPHPEQAVLGQLVHAEIGRFHFFRQLFREPQLHEAGFRVDDGGGELVFHKICGLTIIVKSDIIPIKESGCPCR